jgi:hypothetical protein
VVPSGALVPCGLLIQSNAQQLPPVQASTPSYDPFLATLEYERPAWSPDGQDLFFHGGPPERFPIIPHSQKGGDPSDVLQKLHGGQVAVGKANGRSLTRPWGRMELGASGPPTWMVRRRNKSPKGTSRAPEWSPDGSQLSFLSCLMAPQNLISANGGRAKRIGASLSPAVWSPSGQDVAMIQGQQMAGRVELVVVSLVDGSPDTPKRSGDQYAGRPVRGRSLLRLVTRWT